jgi:hypothetical protein
MSGPIAAEHVSYLVLQTEPHTAQVGADDAIEILGSRILHGTQLCFDACVVDGNIDSPESRHSGVHKVAHIILDANIDLPECNTPRPELCCFSGQVLPIARACAGKIDMRPALCECQHRGAADTARASDDQRGASGETLQINAHVITPKFIANVIKRSCALVRCGELRDGDINKTGLKKSI